MSEENSLDNKESIRSENAQGTEAPMSQATEHDKSENRTKRVLANFRRRCNHIVLVLLVLVTTYLTAGRILMPLLATQKDWLEASLVESLGLDISVAQMRGTWFGFSPVLHLVDVEIFQDRGSQATHSLKELDIALDIPQTILQGQLIIQRVIATEMSLQLVENADGVWNLLGLNSTGNNTEQLLRLLFNTERLQLTETHLNLRLADGSTTNINNLYLDIQNQREQHQAQLQFRLGEQVSPLEMIINLEGDPLAEFTAEAYLDLNNIKLAPLLAQRFSSQVTVSELNGSGEVWLSFNNQMINEVQANLSNLQVLAEPIGGGQSIDLSSGGVELAARQSSNKVWSLWLENLQFDFFNRPWESGDFFLDLDMSAEAMQIDVFGESVDLAIVSDMLLAAELPDSLRKPLTDLKAQGSLSNLYFQTDLSGSYPEGFKLLANLDDVAVDAWSGAPSGSGIMAYLEADQTKGFVELESNDFTIHLPKIFDDSWHYDDITGRVDWSVNSGLVKVTSNVIEAKNDNVHGHVQFDLENQRSLEGNWNSNLTLLIGILDFDASYKSLYLPTLENIRGTMDWLDAAVVSGNIKNSGFIYRGRTNNQSYSEQQTVQTFYQVEDANLLFLNDWPELENVNAFVKVDDNDVYVTAENGEIAGIELDPTVAQLRPLEEGIWLTVNTSATTAGNTGLDFLRDSPIRDIVGTALDGWELEGDINLDVELGIPINSPSLVNDIRVAALTTNNSLYIPEYDLRFNEMRGAVNYYSEEGLFANGLSSTFFDFPLATRISSNDEEILIISNGRVTPAALQQWSLQDQFVRELLDFTAGEFSYEANLQVYNETHEDGARGALRLQSDLLGLAFSLPQPFDKMQEETGALDLSLRFSDSIDTISLNFRDQLSAALMLDGELLSGEVKLGRVHEGFNIRPLNLETGLLITGEIGDFDYAQWEEVSQHFKPQAGNSPAETVRLVDLKMGNLSAFGFDLPAVNTVLQRRDEAWWLYLENEEIKGDLIFPDDVSQAYDIELTYLRIPDNDQDALEGEEIDVLSSVDPSELPAMDFRTDEFRLGEDNMGAWEFKLRPKPSGATISELSMRLPDAAITNKAEDGGADVDWQYSGGQHSSSFSGLFSAGDLADVLPSFGYGALVKSESARFVSDLQWSGSPAAFSLERVNGEVDVEMKTGSFVDIDSGSSRLFGALNFQNVVRRLKLDFSDLYESGLAYDSINGKLAFKDGIVSTEEDLLLKGPSSTIDANGEIDLINETVKADLLVNLPLGQNVSMLAGILGAWPIALSTYLASIIFSDQIGNFTTVLYRLDGPWDNPQAGFESDNAAVENAMEEIGVLETDAE